MQVQNNSSANQEKSQVSSLVPPVSTVTFIPSAGSISPDSPTPAPVKPAVASVAIDQESIEKKFDLKPSKKNANRSSKKQIPTAIGLLILFAALISGVLLFGQGTGVFAPRATPETTPQNIRVSNVTDKTFTVSFYTDESTVAFVKYGIEAGKLNQQASDDRDQLSGIVRDYRLHHITVRGLEANKTYYYSLGTGSNDFDNAGQPYSITTAARPNSSPTSNQTVYGNIFTATGEPAEGAVVYLHNDEIGGLSSIVKASGSFGISLSNAFKMDKTAYASLADEAILKIKAQGIEPGLVSELETTVAMAQPVQDLTLGRAETASLSADTSTVEDKEELLADVTNTGMTATDGASVNLDEQGMESTVSSSLTEAIEDRVELASQAAVVEIVDLDEMVEGQAASEVVIDTTTPKIKASLPPNTIVRITVHSDTQIDETIQTDAEGNLVLDVASLGQNLEPGEHTATYSYIDPTTGEEVTKTYNFTVAPEAPRLLAQASNPTPTPTAAPTTSPSIPYGSGNPYVPGSEISTPTASPTASPTSSISPTPISSAGAIVATNSGQYNSGSLGTTLALLVAGLFFVAMGTWSYLLSSSFEVRRR